MRGEDLQYRLTLTFEEAAFGCKKTITYPRVQRCADCNGSGAAPGTTPETCSVCHGNGQVRVQQRTPLGMFQTTRNCDACGGSGKVIKSPCKNCSGKGYVRINKTLDVSVPAGIDNGERIGLQGQGNDGRNGGGAGDLVIVITVKPHKLFERDRYHLYCELPISFAQAALGAEISVPTLEGDVKFTIPEGTQTGASFTIRGKGVQIVRTNRKGDLIFTVKVTVPKNLTGAQKDLLRAYDEAVTGVSNTRPSFFGKKKDKDKG
jgi:molecular chaperone DnaJ